MFESTILIPTYNRSKQLGATLNFINQTFDRNITEIIILDGSDNLSEKSKNREYSGNLNFRYLHFNGISLWQRILEGVQLVNSKFVSVLDDEDIISFKGYRECVKFLSYYEEYTYCYGLYKDFNLTNRILTSNLTYEQPDNIDNNLYMRLWNYMCPYTTPAFYAVFRKEVFVEMYKTLVEFDVKHSDYCTAEIISGVIPLLYGKSKKIDQFYIGRKRGGDDSSMARFDFTKYFLEENYELGSYKKTYNIIKSVIKQHTELTNQTYNDDAVNHIFAAWLSKNISPNVLRNKFTTLISKRGD